MKEYTKSQKKILRELPNKAYERQLRRELEDLYKKFRGWKENFLSSDALSCEIHKFHNGASRKLYNKFHDLPLDLAVAGAITSGVLSSDEIPAEIPGALSPLIKNLQEIQK